jgi:hypothetical protein
MACGGIAFLLNYDIPMRATCPTLLMFFDVVILILTVKKFKL